LPLIEKFNNYSHGFASASWNLLDQYNKAMEQNGLLAGRLGTL
jgi:hypothetical protein